VLSLSEEIVLLLLDEARGDFVPLPESVFAIVIGGAALMDLALHNRIDTDLDHMIVVDRAPLGDDILDDALARLAKGKVDLDISEALFDVALSAEEYRSRRYPVVDDAEQQEVRARLRQVLLSDDIPDPRDIVLVACSTPAPCLASS
jgi:hypothetical protein